MRRRMLMDLISRGDGVIKYGYFEVKPEIEEERWQVNIDDFIVEVQTDLDATPKKLLCVYIDNKEDITSQAVSIFMGTSPGNAYSGTTNNAGGVIRSESVPFTSVDATYLRYDEISKKTYLHINQWTYIKCGKWMWIAIYDE